MFGLFFIVLAMCGFSVAYGFEPEQMNCTKENLDYVKFLYKSNIDGINQAVALYEESHPNYTMKSLSDYIYTPFLNKASDSAKCLTDLGINPMTVVQFSPDSQKVLSYDHNRLNDTAPLFVKYVPIPEFSNYEILITILFLGVLFMTTFTVRKKDFQL